MIDGLRMHVPTGVERERLKLPGGDRDRVPVGPDFELLVRYCGAKRGVRFATADLRELRSAAAAAEGTFTRLDGAFKHLNAAAKKRALPPPFEPATGATSGATSGAGGGLDTAMYVAPSAAEVLAGAACEDGGAAVAGATAAGSAKAESKAESEAEPEVESEVAEALRFHALADDFMAAFRALAAVVRRKQAEIPEGECLVRAVGLGSVRRGAPGCGSIGSIVCYRVGGSATATPHTPMV